jgi:nucleoside-diphosphate-sugar epimerase
MPVRVLVTGASGTIGTATVAALRGISDCVTTSRGPVPAFPNHRIADLTSAAQARALLGSVRPDVVVHLAGGKGTDERALTERNVACTRELLVAVAVAAPGARVVVAGSAAEYGTGVGLSERAPLRPGTAYGRAKAAQTALAQRLADRYRIRLTVVRPFNTVSPAPPPGSPLGDLFGQLVTSREPRPVLRCGRLDLVRDYLDVGFVATVLARLVIGPVRLPVLNICSGIGTELGAIVAALADRLGREPVFRQDPALTVAGTVDAVTGDPGLLRRTLGLSAALDAAGVAGVLLGDLPHVPTPASLFGY